MLTESPELTSRTGGALIGYVTLGTNDVNRAAAFYDAVLAEIGAKRSREQAKYIAWQLRLDSHNCC